MFHGPFKVEVCYYPISQTHTQEFMLQVQKVKGQLSIFLADKCSHVENTCLNKQNNFLEHSGQRGHLSYMVLVNELVTFYRLEISTAFCNRFNPHFYVQQNKKSPVL